MLSILAPGARRATERSAAPQEPPRPDQRPEAPASVDISGRKATRYPASMVPAITGIRISARGIEARLVNISATGLLAECRDRLQTGNSVTVAFDGSFVPARVGGKVVRNYVASVGPDGALRYHIGIAFLDRIALEVEDGGAREAPPPAAPRRVVRNRW